MGSRLAERTGKALRVLWTLASFLSVEMLVFVAAVVPAAFLWERQKGFHETLPLSWLRSAGLALSFIPCYLLFAFLLMVCSACATRWTGWRTPRDVETPLADLDWRLLDWVRYSMANRLVELLAGMIFCSTPLWTLYMRLNGARIGRRVYVNSLGVTDHNLLELGDDVVIGGGVHLSGHTVERGLLKTAPVRLGAGVTIGVGSVIDIGVEVGQLCQIGAMSVVPKFSKLEAGATYVGAPATKLDHHPAELTRTTHPGRGHRV